MRSLMRGVAHMTFILKLGINEMFLLLLLGLAQCSWLAPRQSLVFAVSTFTFAAVS